MNVSKPYMTYTPGSGYTGYLPGYDKPALRWGKEFIAQELEKIKQNAANKVETPVSPNGPGRYDPQKLEDFDRRELSREELRTFAAGLSEKYDPSSMTQEDYDSFLDDLVEKGLLSEYELGTLGYHGFEIVGNLADVVADDAYRVGTWRIDTNNPDWDTYFSRYGHVRSLLDAKGDALAYTKMMSLWGNPDGSAAFVKWAETKQNAYTIMADVLEAIQRERSR